MQYRVLITPRAEEDIYRNAVWWSQHHSLEQAITWKDAIYEQLESLRTLPERCSFAKENVDHPEELRQLLVGLGNQTSYRAIFTIRNDEIHVLTVHRASQDAASF